MSLNGGEKKTFNKRFTLHHRSSLQSVNNIGASAILISATCIHWFDMKALNIHVRAVWPARKSKRPFCVFETQDMHIFDGRQFRIARMYVINVLAYAQWPYLLTSSMCCHRIAALHSRPISIIFICQRTIARTQLFSSNATLQGYSFDELVVFCLTKFSYIRIQAWLREKK